MLRFLKGEELKEVVLKTLSNHKYKLKIVDNITNSLNYSQNVRLIKGDRRRGKTIAMLGVIKELDDYENCALVTLDEEIDMDELIEEVKKIKPIKYLFIDEVTYIKKLKPSMKQLSDFVCPVYADKVIVSGTWSQALETLKINVWLGRVIEFEAFPLSPLDMRDYYGIKTINGYLESGGYFPSLLKAEIAISQENFSGIPLTDMFTQYLNLYLLNKGSSIEECTEEIAIDKFINYIAALYSYNFPEIGEVNNVIQKNFYKIRQMLGLQFRIVANELKSVTKEDIIDVFKVLLFNGISKFIHNTVPDKAMQALQTNVLSEYEVRQSLKIGNIVNNRGLQLEHYLLRYTPTISEFFKLQNKEIDMEIDGVDHENRNLIEIKLGENPRGSWKKHLKNDEILKQYGLDSYNKIIVYPGESFKEDGISYMNVYEYFEKYCYGKILTPWEDKKEINSSLGWE